MIRRCRRHYRECNSENSRGSVQVSKTCLRNCPGGEDNVTDDYRDRRAILLSDTALACVRHRATTCWTTMTFAVGNDLPTFININ